MPQPFKQVLTIADTASTSGSARIADVDVRALIFSAGFDGATIKFQAVAIASVQDATPVTGDYVDVNDSAGSVVTVTVSAGKWVTLTEAQRDALSGAHWVRAVSASAQSGGAGTVTLVGKTLYK